MAALDRFHCTANIASQSGSNSLLESSCLKIKQFDWSLRWPLFPWDHGKGNLHIESILWGNGLYM